MNFSYQYQWYQRLSSWKVRVPMNALPNVPTFCCGIIDLYVLKLEDIVSCLSGNHVSAQFGLFIKNSEIHSTFQALWLSNNKSWCNYPNGKSICLWSNTSLEPWPSKKVPSMQMWEFHKPVSQILLTKRLCNINGSVRILGIFNRLPQKKKTTEREHTCKQACMRQANSYYVWHVKSNCFWRNFPYVSRLHYNI